MRRDSTVSRRTTRILGLCAAVSFCLVCVVRLAAPTGDVFGFGTYAFFARLALFGSVSGLCFTWAHARGLGRPFQWVVNLLLRKVRGGNSQKGLPNTNGPPGTTWNGSRWVSELSSGPTFGASSQFSNGHPSSTTPQEHSAPQTTPGYGMYQTHETNDERRRRVEREVSEAERWARVEAEDEAREDDEGRRRSDETYGDAQRRKHDEKHDQKAKLQEDKKDAKARKWQVHDTRWDELETRTRATSSGETSTEQLVLGYDDVPWPPKMNKLLEKTSRGAEPGSRELKAAYHQLVRRWHPDKFVGKFGNRLLATDREKILARVNAVANALNAAWRDAK